MKFVPPFNPANCVEDKKAVDAFKNSFAFKYLANHTNLRVFFHKHINSESTYSSIHYSYTPLEQVNTSFFSKIKSKIFEHLGIHKNTKFEWIASDKDSDLGKKISAIKISSMVDKIS